MAMVWLSWGRRVIGYDSVPDVSQITRSIKPRRRLTGPVTTLTSSDERFRQNWILDGGGPIPNA